MDWNSFEANWKHFEGWLKQKWGRLTKDDCEYISGSRDRLVGRLQEKYGLTKVEAERDADEWYGSVISGERETTIP